MTTFAILMTIAAWWSALRWHKASLLKLLVSFCFMAVGGLLAIFGWFNHWWNSSGYSDPEAGNLTIPICGVLILVAQLIVAPALTE